MSAPKEKMKISSTTNTDSQTVTAVEAELREVTPAAPYATTAIVRSEYRRVDGEYVEDDVPKRAEARNLSVGDFRSLREQTDVSLGQEFAEICGNDLRYDHSRQRWLIWDDPIWRPDADKAVHRAAELLARKRYEAAYDYPGSAKEWGKAVTFAKKRGAGAYMLEKIVQRAQHQLPIGAKGSEFDCDPMLLGVVNGVVDLTTGKLRSGRCEDYLTKASPVPFDPDAKCPRFERFLEEVFQDNKQLIAFVHRAIGYSLTGDNREEVFFMLYGSGSNGKSTLLESLQAAIGADYAGKIDFDALCSEYRSRHKFDLANIEGKRLVTASEPDRKIELSSKVVKSLVGDGKIAVEEKFKQPRLIAPTHKLWLAVNTVPLATDRTEGFWRRIRLIPFNASFKERPDNTLKPTLISELPGILAWAVRGCLAWQEQGLGKCPAVDEATQEFREQSDVYYRFINDCLIEAPDSFILPEELKKAYEQWRELNPAAPEYGQGKALLESLKAQGAYPEKPYMGTGNTRKQVRVWRRFRLKAA